MATAQLASVLQQLRTMVHAGAYQDTSDRELLERFLAQREEAAFVALLKRHGPMVLHVCRRIQGNEHDAEDAFQATFLLLARKAGSIRKLESVASWLHGVAQRLAREAKSQGARRQARERRAADMRRTAEVSDQMWQELQGTLDEALRQVPEKYRTPLLLCYLEGKTQEEAARQLWRWRKVRRRPRCLPCFFMRRLGPGYGMRQVEQHRRSFPRGPRPWWRQDSTP